jgi:ketosteroid isomerase-like protein
MNPDYPDEHEQIRLAKTYFSKVDAGDGDLLGLFTEDVQAYFPKIGTTRGKAELVQLVQRLTRVVPRFAHDPALMVFTREGSRLVVEGTETGVFADGTPWPVGAGSEGRYCNVFDFEGPLIRRLFIYVDPDFAGRYDNLFPGP